MKATALAVALTLGGCATIFNGTRQTVRIGSDSPEATLRVNGSITSPGEHELRRGKDHLVTAELPGRRLVSSKIKREMSWGWLILDCVIAVVTFPFGLAAPILDFVTGGIWELEPDTVQMPEPTEPQRTAY